MQCAQVRKVVIDLDVNKKILIRATLTHTLLGKFKCRGLFCVKTLLLPSDVCDSCLHKASGFSVDCLKPRRRAPPLPPPPQGVREGRENTDLPILVRRNPNRDAKQVNTCSTVKRR